IRDFHVTGVQTCALPIWIKRDDLTPLAMGGNKTRKLEYLGADALRAGADTLVTAGAIQSNHVRQTAALAARLGMECHALLENPKIGRASCRERVWSSVGA